MSCSGKDSGSVRIERAQPERVRQTTLERLVAGVDIMGALDNAGSAVLMVLQQLLHAAASSPAVERTSPASPALRARFRILQTLGHVATIAAQPLRVLTQRALEDYTAAWALHDTSITHDGMHSADDGDIEYEEVIAAVFAFEHTSRVSHHRQRASRWLAKTGWNRCARIEVNPTTALRERWLADACGFDVVTLTSGHTERAPLTRFAVAIRDVRNVLRTESDLQREKVLLPLQCSARRYC